MTYTALVRLTNYKQWTESLGYDREWVIQVTQSEIYHNLQLLSKEFNGFALPLRYDVQVVILPSNTSANHFINKLNEVVVKWLPIRVGVDLYCGLPHEALNNSVKSGECQSSEVCVIHLDLNNFTSQSIYKGFYRPYVEVLNMSCRLALRLMDKSVVQYLGGDNVVIITYPHNLDEVLEAIRDEVIRDMGVKVGVGISEYPKKAFELAAKALSILRAEKRSSECFIIKE